jgi:large subunit ribosomal protein L5
MNMAKARLLEKYRNEIVPLIEKKLGISNRLQAPRIEKIVLNMGIGEGASDIKPIDQAVAELALIAGQRPVITRAKKAIANFKIKRGNPVGCKVTLRGARMYEFLDRLIHVAIPRIRDFRGLSPGGFDEHGNYTMGIDDQTIFVEVDYDKVYKVRGMNITIAVENGSPDKSYELLRLFGMPFRNSRG